MDLTDFVKDVLVSVNAAVDQARQQTSRDIHFTYSKASRTVEFDIAVSAEDKKSAKGTAGVRVLQFVEAGGDLTSTQSNSTVSRIKFGVDIEQRTKEEQAKIDAAWSSRDTHVPGIFNLDERY